jgi:tripartite-type tricarboxylate transporter receptor subunit TctC
MLLRGRDYPSIGPRQGWRFAPPRCARLRPTAPEIIAILNRQVNAALADPTFKARLVDLGLEPYATSPAEFGKFIVDYTEKWGKVIRDANIKPE